MSYLENIFKWLSVSVLCQLTIARPSEKLKIVFNNDKVSSLFDNNCNLVKGEVFWQPDGKCYTIGERGPCEQTEILAVGFERQPECSSTLITPLSKTSSTKDDKIKPETRIEFSEDRQCHEEWEVSFNGSCFPLLEQGPCAEGEWLVVSPYQSQGDTADSDDFLEYLGVGVSVTCVTRPCDARDGVFWWPELCECVGSEPGLTRYTVSDVCSDHEEMVATPHGQGVCTCQPGYSYDQDEVCHELGTRGPCDEDMLWDLDPESKASECRENATSQEIKMRVFDSIPANTVRTAQAKKCFVDERGKCRQILNLRGLFGEETDLEFTHWIKTFSRLRGSVEPEECRLRSCRGDELVWHDGQCHQLASTGPCDPGSWLVLEDIIRGQPRLVCQQRRCRGSGVWWADTCACVETRVRSGLDWPCAETETLMVSPYGNGVCAYHQDTVRIFDSIPVNSVKASRQTCFVDEQGKCRKVAILRRRISSDIIEEDSGSGDPGDIIDLASATTQDLVEWLQQFKRPSDDTCPSSKIDEDLTEPVDIGPKTQRECHRQGKVLFEDGGCYNLLERGPCFEDSMWLVMTEREDGSLAAECRPRLCADPQQVWDPASCACYDVLAASNVTSDTPDDTLCGPGEQLMLDIFGQGICGCKDGHSVWEEDGLCYEHGQQGPCPDDETFNINHDTSIADCRVAETEEDRSSGMNDESTPHTRIFDIIPGGSNSINHNTGSTVVKVNSQTCVLDARGKCRRKVNFKRGTPKVEEEEFKIWLNSFLVRAPKSFECE